MGSDQFSERFFEHFSTFVCANSPSGFDKPLGLRLPYFFGFGPNLFGFTSHIGLSSTSRSIGQPLADDTGKRPIGAHGIVSSKPDPVVIPEIELRKVAMQVLL